MQADALGGAAGVNEANPASFLVQAILWAQEIVLTRIVA